MEITKEILHELFEYKDGNLYWKIRLSNSVRVGDKAGNITKKGYVTVRINRKLLYLHRLIYIFHYGNIKDQIDHIDGNGLNNKIENLRQATRQQNNQNARKRSDNTSKHKGVSWSKAANKWISYVNINGKPKHLGCFTDIELAAFVAEEARNKYHGEFANHGKQDEKVST